ncbi:threonine-phosphate decarboxylase [Paenibacillus chitinolyticus]|uniref:threonine-phosphate decarboxylase CobD n=1 Tax=Paenibacillus chitinolyticus TaxID=79263 RepID=UPI0026E49D2E|nr:threonine-phosphate decarboxylase CobD [Paenibacillus chitinolyticus]GKS10824.1 threonine-phosphate decarboxylase [Paenibacillus chitinolyticus]
MLERYGHGGDVWTAEEKFGRGREQFLDFSSNMNPFGPPDAVEEVLRSGWKNIVRYPDPAVRELRGKIAAKYGVPAESVLVGNGAAELIDLIVRVLQPEVTALARPSFSEYEDAVLKTGGRIHGIPLRAEHGFRLQKADAEEALKRSDLLFLGQPNNPTGRLIPQELLNDLAGSGHPLILDEAFLDFVPDEKNVTLLRLAAESRHVAVIRSMTKFYAIPGARLGFIVAHPDVISRMSRLQVPWSVNYFAQLIGCAVLEDEAFHAKTISWLQEESPRLAAGLAGLGLEVTPSDTNYLLCALPEQSPINVRILQEEMGRRGVLIRDASLFEGLGTRYFRTAVKLRGDNERMLAALSDVLKAAQAGEISFERGGR